MGTGTGTRAAVGAELELAARLRMVVRRMDRRLRQADDQGITPSQLSALATIDRLGPLTLGRLASVERVQPPSMTRIVGNLEEAGLVVRQVDDQDRRVARVIPTAEGRKALARSRTRKNAYLARRIGGLDPREHQLVADAVEVLERLLEEES